MRERSIAKPAAIASTQNQAGSLHKKPVLCAYGFRLHQCIQAKGCAVDSNGAASFIQTVVKMLFHEYFCSLSVNNNDIDTARNEELGVLAVDCDSLAGSVVD